MGRLRTAFGRFQAQPDVWNSPVPWANLGPISRLLAGLVKPRRRPLLILSLPRSGSSWIGTILGRAPWGLYLREPLNQSRLALEGPPTVFTVQTQDRLEIPASYRVAAKNAFGGVPTFSPLILRDPERWRMLRLLAASRDTRTRIVVKCVNPLALPWLQKNFQFDLVVLIRHPAAVAASWHRMGWTGLDLAEILEPQLYRTVDSKHERSFWSRHGVLQALAHEVVFDVLEQLPADSYRVVSYEGLCRAPEDEFEALFRHAGFPYDESERRRVREHSSATGDRGVDPFSTRRRSSAMPDRWKTEVPEEALHELRCSYLSFDRVPVYADETAW